LSGEEVIAGTSFGDNIYHHNDDWYEEKKPYGTQQFIVDSSDGIFCLNSLLLLFNRTKEYRVHDLSLDCRARGAAAKYLQNRGCCMATLCAAGLKYKHNRYS
jgi:hypothetical protein